MYQRKTIDQYFIYGKTTYGKEEIDVVNTRQEAKEYIKEYKMAFGLGWSLWIIKKRVNK